MLVVLLFINLMHVSANESALEAKVVGGQTHISLYPHAAFLYVKKRTGDHMCGSSILNQKILLTAAHCIERPFDSMSAFAGHTVNNLGDRYPVLDVRLHEKYDERSVDHDIGIILVAKSIKLGPLVQRVAIGYYALKPETAAVAGWGLIDEDNKVTSKYLHHAKLRVWTYERCRKFMSSLPRGFICAGDFDGKTYASSGDSGSGLIVNGYIQIGVVSYKRQDLRSIVAFTDVSYYYLWIKDTARRLYCAY